MNAPKLPVTAEIHESSPTFIRAIYREPYVREYELEASRDDFGENWYIKVVGEDGLHTYDGYWMRSERKTQAEVIVEGAHGSFLGDDPPTVLSGEIRKLQSLLGAALGALRYHTEQTRPIHRTSQIIAAIEKELEEFMPGVKS